MEDSVTEFLIVEKGGEISLHHSILVLVVDDSAFERQVLASELLKCGFEVETANDGRSALDRMTADGKTVPDIVLMDALMPVMDGFEACKAIRALPPAQSAPVLMITGREDADSIGSAFDAGAEDYIVKPVNIVLLHRRIQRIVTAQKAEALVREMAFRDILTGLPNRRMFEEELVRRLSHAQRYKEPMAVVLLDLDKFKQINDSMGHAVGDAVLREISRRFLATVRASDLVARLGGDEFLMILSHVGDPESVGPLMNRIAGSCEQPIPCDGANVKVGVSIGVSFFPRDGQDAVELMRKADIAMYRSKIKNRNNSA